MLKHKYDGKDQVVVTSWRLKYKDYHHLKNLYTTMHEWLVEEGWATRSDQDFPEDYFVMREKPHEGGNEVWWWWTVKKTPVDKGGQNSYYQWVMDINVHVILLKDVEVIHEGQKFKTNWGEPEIKAEARLIMDKDDVWKKHPLLKYFNTIVHKRILLEKFQAQELELYRECYRFQEAIKTWLQMKTWLPEPELGKFWPEKGLGSVQ